MGGFKDVRIAIQGELGSFSHQAALRLFAGPEIVPCALSAQVFESLENGAVDAAVIPIENTLAGPVAEHYDLLLKHDVRIVKEIRLRIRHNLIGMPGAKLEEISQVMSHPVALAQCRIFLAKHPGIKVLPFYDTAGSVKHLMETRDAHAAGIAGEQAAAEFSAEILASGIEDNAENYTRFLVVKKNQPQVPPLRSASVGMTKEAPVGMTKEALAGMTDDVVQPNKLSLAFAVEHKPGTLVAALEGMARAGVNLTRIESRPVPGRPWEYVFFVDLGFVQPQMAEAALASLTTHCNMVKELGRYVAAQ